VEDMSADLVPEFVKEPVAPTFKLQKYCWLKKRETHPFRTEIGLIGGGKHRNRRLKRSATTHGRIRTAPRPKTDRKVGGANKLTFIEGNDQSNACVTWLKYMSETSIGSSIAYYADNWNINNSYDKKGSLLTESLYNFARYGVLWGYNIITHIEYDIVFTNKGPNALTIGLVPSIVFPLIPASTNDARDFLESPNAKYVTLGTFGSGQETKTLKYSLNIPKYYGLPSEYLYSGLYSCSSGSGPANTLLMNLVAWSPGSSVGFEMRWVEQDKIRFYAANVLRDADREANFQKIVDKCHELKAAQKTAMTDKPVLTRTVSSEMSLVGVLPLARKKATF